MDLTLLRVMAVVVLVHLCWTAWCCWKAKKAYLAAKELYEWANAVHDPLVCAVAATNCEPGSGPGWPPDSPGDFPPSDA